MKYLVLLLTLLPIALLAETVNDFRTQDRRVQFLGDRIAISSVVDFVNHNQTNVAGIHLGGVYKSAWPTDQVQNADTVDYYHAGNSNGNVAVNNGILNTNLHADLLDGQDGTVYRNATNINAGKLVNAFFSAYTNLSYEGFLNDDSNVDILTRVQGDGRWLGLTAKAADSSGLDGQAGTYYRNAGNINAGKLGHAYFSAWTNLMYESQLRPFRATNVLVGAGNTIDATGLSSILGGSGNLLYGGSGIIGAGANNQIGQSGTPINYCAIVSGQRGFVNVNSAHAFIGAGIYCYVNGIRSFVGGGFSNSVGFAGQTDDGAICGGYENRIYNGCTASFIGGGRGNIVSPASTYSTIGGGISGNIDGLVSTIAGGEANEVGRGAGTASASTISGGKANWILGGYDYSAIAGGVTNVVYGQGSFIGAGFDNYIGYSSHADFGFVGAGKGNRIYSGDYEFIGGGASNYIVDADFCGVLSGGKNYVEGAGNVNSVVCGGLQNRVSGSANAVGKNSILGGYNNVINNGATYGYNSIAGGYNNTITGWCSLAFGHDLYISHSNAVVFGDNGGGAAGQSQAHDEMLLADMSLLIDSRGLEIYGGCTNHGGEYIVGRLDVGGVKNFRIPHPVVEGKDLIHFSVEGPKPDLLYRGKTTLTNGASVVDIDVESRMTDGTFVALTRNQQAFVQNDTGWEPVKAQVRGNKLVVWCKDNTSTDTVGWMVVAERNDAFVRGSGMQRPDGGMFIEPEGAKR